MDYLLSQTAPNPYARGVREGCSATEGRLGESINKKRLRNKYFCMLHLATNIGQVKVLDILEFFIAFFANVIGYYRITVTGGFSNIIANIFEEGLTVSSA